MRNSETLETIYLNKIEVYDWLKDDSKVDFFGRCLELTEVKISDGTNFRSEQLDLMIESFPPKLSKIELSHFLELSDLHVEKLVRKFDKITEFSLRSNDVITNQSRKHFIMSTEFDENLSQ